MIKVSVIIPTYGKPIFLEKAIFSVLNQTLKSLELIVVDDNNPQTDARKQTEDILNKVCSLDSRVKYIKHEKNKNGAVARNTGIAVATGEVISFLDSDDEYILDRLELCYNALINTNNNYAGVYTGCEFRRNGKTYCKYLNVESGNHIVEALACTFMFCTGSNFFVRKRVVEELNGFDEIFLRHQDFEFLVRLFQKYELYGIRKILVIKNNENFNLPNVEKQIQIKELYLTKFIDIINLLPQHDINFIFRKNCVSIAENALAQKKRKIALLYYRKALNYNIINIKEIIRMFVLFFYSLIKK